MPTSCASHWPESPFPAPSAAKLEVLGTLSGKRANSPAASTPQIPPTACTEIPPLGSSTVSRNSNTSTASVTNAPAARPMTTAPSGVTNAQLALLATNPQIKPFALSDASGLQKRRSVILAPHQVA